MAANASSDSGNTMFYEDPNEQVNKRGGDAVKEDEQGYVHVGASDDSMSQATETAKPSKKVVSLTIKQSSDSSGNTEFYEDPTTQAQEMVRDAEVGASSNITTTG